MPFNMPLKGNQAKSLEDVLASTSSLWKGRFCNRAQATISTGHKILDHRLPGEGWPRGAVTELITAHSGVGEFSLLFPALAATGRQGHWIILVDPPWVPYPATLHGHGLNLERLVLIRTQKHDESLWACEQALREIPESVVLSWPKDVRFATLRRLQLAAQSQRAIAFMFRPETTASAASPAALRLKLDSAADGMRIEVLKCRGHSPAEPLMLPQPYCRRQSTYERSSMVGSSAAAPGTGLSYPRSPGISRPSRHH